MLENLQYSGVPSRLTRPSGRDVFRRFQTLQDTLGRFLTPPDGRTLLYILLQQYSLLIRTEHAVYCLLFHTRLNRSSQFVTIEVTMVICPILSDNPDVFSPTQSNKTVRITEARTLSFQKSVMCPIIRTLKAKLCFYSKAILEAVLLSARKTSETVR